MPISLVREVELAKNMMELSPVFVLRTEPEIDVKDLSMRKESRLDLGSIL